MDVEIMLEQMKIILEQPQRWREIRELKLARLEKLLTDKGELK